MKPSYDCVVVGGGPAGGAAASILAESGIKTLLIEREPVPRFHVGESLMPETFWALERLGLNERVRSSGWQIKKSVQFVTHQGTESAPFFFRQHDDRDNSDTWQVERSEFDKMLFDRAAELGADCHDRTRLIDVNFNEAGAIEGVTVKDATGNLQQIDCRVLVDATGQQAFIANKLGLKEVNPDLKKAAIWGYWKGAVRGEADNEGATIIMNTETKDAWFWFIPMSRGVTSIGCVADNDYLLKNRGTPEQTYREELGRCPGLKPRLKSAMLLGELKTAKEFSYTTKQHAGDGWVLIGDAYGFIDPVYSSGVYFALEMGVRAADAIVEGFAQNRLNGEQLSKWTEEFNQGVHWMRSLVRAFYERDFSIGRFMKEHPEHRGNVTDLLIGRIFHDQAGNVFPDMQASIERVKAAAESST